MFIFRHQVSTPPGAALGADFWWVFASSTCFCVVNGAAAPFLARYALDTFGATPSAVGLIVASSSIAAIVLRPLMGVLADRYGLRRVSILSGLGEALGMTVLMVARGIAPATLGRLVGGISSSAANTALMAWVVGLVPLERRGRALGVFGVSVWVGFGAGPPIGEMLVSAGGYTALWIGCAALGLTAAACVSRARAPWIGGTAPAPPRHPLHLVRLVARPGAAGALAFAGQAMTVTFLIVHLEGRGLPAGGIDGAATVFTVFAITVIGARVLTAAFVDRVGAGLGTLAVASSFPAAALGGVLLGLGFAPLFPALALLATERLRPKERASGLGVFGAFMDGGMAAGSIAGGVLIATVGSGAAFGALAASQIVALLLVLGARPQRSSSLAGLETSMEVAEASERPPA